MGYAVLSVSGTELKVEDLGVLKMQKLKDHQSKLKEIFLQTQDIIETYQPKIMAIESPFFGKNVQSMLKLGRAQGVAMAAGLSREIPITEYLPKNFNVLAGKNDIDWSKVELIEIEEEIELGFDTKDYLPMGFNPYRGMDFKHEVVVCLN